jgi:hypothetical protein
MRVTAIILIIFSVLAWILGFFTPYAQKAAIGAAAVAHPLISSTTLGLSLGSAAVFALPMFAIYIVCAIFMIKMHGSWKLAGIGCIVLALSTLVFSTLIATWLSQFFAYGGSNVQTSSMIASVSCYTYCVLNIIGGILVFVCGQKEDGAKYTSMSVAGVLLVGLSVICAVCMLMAPAMFQALCSDTASIPNVLVYGVIRAVGAVGTVLIGTSALSATKRVK